MKKVKLNILKKVNLLLGGCMVLLGFGCNHNEPMYGIVIAMYGIPIDSIDTLVHPMYGINYTPFEVKDTITPESEKPNEETIQTNIPN